MEIDSNAIGSACWQCLLTMPVHSSQQHLPSLLWRPIRKADRGLDRLSSSPRHLVEREGVVRGQWYRHNCCIAIIAGVVDLRDDSSHWAIVSNACCSVSFECSSKELYHVQIEFEVASLAIQPRILGHRLLLCATTVFKESKDWITHKDATSDHKTVQEHKNFEYRNPRHVTSPA